MLLVVSRPAESGLGPRWIFFLFSDPQARAVRLKHFTLTQTLTSSSRVTWVRSERVNLYNSQIMILPQRQKHMHSWAQGPLPDRRAPVICTSSPPLPPCRRQWWAGIGNYKVYILVLSISVIKFHIKFLDKLSSDERTAGRNTTLLYRCIMLSLFCFHVIHVSLTHCASWCDVFRTVYADS